MKAPSRIKKEPTLFSSLVYALYYLPVLIVNDQLKLYSLHQAACCKSKSSVQIVTLPGPGTASRMSTVFLKGTSLFQPQFFFLVHFSQKCCVFLKFSRRTFFQHQDRYLHVAVGNVWKNMQMSMLSLLQLEEESLVLGGDGRCDSPGFSAKYGSYSFMDLHHNVVLNVELVQVCNCQDLLLSFTIIILVQFTYNV